MIDLLVETDLGHDPDACQRVALLPRYTFM
jgi:hypothetical protein